MKIILSFGLLLWACAFGCSQQPPSLPDAVDSVAVAPLRDALTFARAKSSSGARLLAVLSYTDEGVTAVDLSSVAADPIDAFQSLGYEDLVALVQEAQQNEEIIQVAHDELLIPVRLRNRHIAAGTNFVAHAEESAVEDGPFLFVKAVVPTMSGTPVIAAMRLLDYEVELAFVTLATTDLRTVPATMGLILSNDFTDRAALLRNANVNDIVSGDGFTTGKSAPGFLPVGNLFVIARDVLEFYPQLQLHLAVNGEPRQAAPMSWVVWDLAELFRQSLLREGRQWAFAGTSVTLPVDQGLVPGRTLLMAGTPAGTVFQGVPGLDMVLGGLDWVLGGWSLSLFDNVIEQYVDAAHEGGRYLQPGDRVNIRVDFLGEIETAVN